MKRKMKMKKMLIAIFALVAICSAQAATLPWGVSGLYYEGIEVDNPDGDVPHEFQWALIDLGTSQDASGLTFHKGVFAGPETAEKIAYGSLTDIWGAGPMFSEGATAGNYYTLLVYSPEVDKWGRGDIVKAVVNPTDPTASGNTLMDVVFDAPGVLAPWDWGEDRPGGILADQPSEVPEPTSMALLILGAAVFGLRRKVRG